VNRTPARITGMRLSSSGDVLVIMTSDGLARIWSLRTGQLAATARLRDSLDMASVAVSDQLEAAILRRNGGAELMDLMTGQVQRSVQTGPVETGAISSNARSVIVVSRGGGSIVDLGRGTIAPWGGGATPASVAAIDPGERFVALAGADGAVRITELGGRLARTFASDGTPVEALAWQGQGQVVSVLERGGRLRWLTLSSDTPPRSAMISEGRAVSLAADPQSDRTLIASASGRMLLFDGATGALQKTFTEEDNCADYLAVVPGGRFALSACGGVIKLWDLGKAVSRAQIMITQSGWAIVDSLGRFDGDDGGLADVRWQAARLIIPIERFARHRQPGLLGRILIAEGEFERGLPAVQNGVAPPPSASFIEVPSAGLAGSLAHLKVRADDRGGGIASVVLFRNGGVIGSATAPAGQTRGLVAEFDVTLVAGANSFRAIVTDRLGVESEPAAAVISVPEPDRPGVQYYYSIAVDRYRSPAIRSLSLGVRDALALESSLAGSGRGAAGNVQVRRLHDEAATQAAVLDLLASLRTLSPRDSIVVFLGGHGIVLGDEWVFLPHDAVLRDSTVERTVGASALQDAIAGTPARQVMVVIDSCESGQVASRLNDFLERGSLAAMARNGGITLLAASRADQPAYESRQLGHGLLTAALLQGLAGAADPGRRDGRISAYALASYAEANVPILARHYFNQLQIPMAVTRGNNFTVKLY
jgi:WD40 repeat protein